MNSDLKVGDKLLLVEDGSNSGRFARNNNQPYKQMWGVITKVGRKYLTISKYEGSCIEIKAWKEDLKEYIDNMPCYNYSIYRNEEEYLASCRSKTLESALLSAVGTGSLRGKYSLEQLEAVVDILNVEVPNDA